MLLFPKCPINSLIMDGLFPRIFAKGNNIAKDKTILDVESIASRHKSGRRPHSAALSRIDSRSHQSRAMRRQTPHLHRSRRSSRRLAIYQRRPKALDSARKLRPPPPLPLQCGPRWRDRHRTRHRGRPRSSRALARNERGHVPSPARMVNTSFSHPAPTKFRAFHHHMTLASNQWTSRCWLRRNPSGTGSH